ncbi:hypothetical protein N5923_07705 [Erwiniaceae bacterium BAC15a-03b]|uniref:PEGA domain-containing protein n=1 Tax=Winslowiella arboricola TaxID=2978220 RepID=A0A9J6PLQ5_9GAMM|nr:hypothetical protein [Winslowiella arboricola]MCU5773902.1 hypothetical protein [Winslowiella arboricola]MCU5777371.1 hypothetical protein [Winslowiella arboricola]
MKAILLALISLVMLSGCATIVGDKTQAVRIDSRPQGASVVVQDETGRAVAQGHTPLTVTLEKSDGSYFGKKHFRVMLEAPGYVPQTLALEERVSLWYSLGNIPLGGFIGWLIVDPFYGGMYYIEPEGLQVIMNPVGARG